MKLENKEYVVEFSLHGAEMTRLYEKQSGIEYLHDGNPKYWSGRNPTLFPKVGQSNDGVIRIKGVQYSMGNHGFLRSAPFVLSHQNDASISFRFDSNKETKKQYPFDFTVIKTYVLQENTVTITHEVTNTGKSMMPFTIGHHPAFRCPILAGESVEDYRITFDQPEDHLGFETTTKAIDLPYDRYHLDSLMMCNLNSSVVSLEGPKHGVKVSVIGHPIVTIWPMKATPFVCIEPWLSSSDEKEFDGEFQDKPGMIWLEPNRMFMNSYEFMVY